jgi:hypothetical protein
MGSIPLRLILSIDLSLSCIIFLFALSHSLADFLQLLNHIDDLLFNKPISFQQIEDISLASDLRTLLVRRVLDNLIIEVLLSFLPL